MGGWGLIAANIIVLSNLAGVAVDFFYLMLAQVFSNPELADLSNLPLNIATMPGVHGAGLWVTYRGMDATKLVQYCMVGFQLLVLGWFVVWRSATSPTGGLRRHRHLSRDWFNPSPSRLLRAVRRRRVTGRLRLLGLGRLPDHERGNQEGGKKTPAGPEPTRRWPSWSSTSTVDRWPP